MAKAKKKTTSGKKKATKATRKSPKKAAKKTVTKAKKTATKAAKKSVKKVGSKVKLASASTKRGGKTAMQIVKARNYKMGKGETARFGAKGSKIHFVKAGKATGQSLKR